MSADTRDLERLAEAATHLAALVRQGVNPREMANVAAFVRATQELQIRIHDAGEWATRCTAELEQYIAAASVKPQEN